MKDNYNPTLYTFITLIFMFVFTVFPFLVYNESYDLTQLSDKQLYILGWLMLLNTLFIVYNFFFAPAEE